ncbi:EamA family transporter [Legionella sp. PATHC035]|uniref:DMT family transporter n=1 Tax=Legionella sp. PATHC035 TaxID=2992040 RepID=UPI002244AE23|nr:DMT family transporter [Legionella sp. PATHC035]MCW8408815.1 EamA family transporter [Legionella sp. PATHC035]
MNDKTNTNPGYWYAILSAVLFGAATPAAKFLLETIHPLLLAGLLYLGAAVGLFIIFFFQRYITQSKAKEASLRYRDMLWLGSAVVLGGILGPVFLMVGLMKLPAASASLLLNLESVFTALIAWLAFKEHVDRTIAMGMMSIVIGSFMLSWKGSLTYQNILGPLLIAGACMCWAIDNNLTRKISAANPLQIAMLKSLIAGLTNTTIAMVYGAILPTPVFIISAGTVGFLGYGVSLLLFILGLRHIGTARTGAYFALAPFVGAGFAIIFLNEPLSLQLILASLFMGIGIWLHLSEYHSHAHQHEAMEHEHRHMHDAHHQHEHQPTDPPGEPHTHWHQHKPLYHTHPHFPDIHHRHKH